MSRRDLALADGAVIAKRNLIKIKRVPDLLVFTTLSPIMFVLLFAYVFGSAIDVPGVNYREFLIAGIFAQTVIFGVTFTGAGLAEDMQKGIIDRFRSLPMARRRCWSAARRATWSTTSSVDRVMSLTGLLVGWRIHSSVLEALAGFLLLLLFAYAFSWVMAYVGLLGAQPRGGQQRVVHRYLPADVHRQHVRADRRTCPTVCRRSPSGTRSRR